MPTLTRPAPQDTTHTAPPRRPWLPAALERLLDGAVVVLATWTLVYHVCLLLRLDVVWAVGLEVVALAAAAGLWWRVRGRLPAGAGEDRADMGSSSPTMSVVGRPVAEVVLLAVAVTAGVAAAVLVAVRGSWPLVSGLWLVAAVTGAALAAVHLRRAGAPAPERHAGPGADVVATAESDASTTEQTVDNSDATTGEPPVSAEGRERRALPSGAVVALLWASALAVLALLARRPNPDDLYYVNLAQWVVDRGTFPLRDTIFSDLAFPMSSWPPVASYDALVGTVARLIGVPAASVVYLVVPPLVTFLSVLALWRLLREWRVPAVAAALSLALILLLFDGGPGYAAPGNLFLTRLWQGKVVLLCLLVPTLLVYALRYVERPTRTRAGWLLAGGIASVGLTTSAMFVIPLVAAAGAAPLALRRPRRALSGFAAMAAYPLAAGIVTLVVGGRSADFFGQRRLFRFEPEWFGHEIFRDGPIALIAVLAVLAGALLIPRVAARLTAGLLAVIVGVTFVPGVTYLAFDLVGLGPTLWRVSWIVPIAALVGVLGVRLGSYGGRRVAMTATAAVVAAVLIVTGVPIWSGENAVVVNDSPQWNLDDTESARRIINTASDGDIVLAHQRLAITITVLTTRIKTIAPRDYFMDYLRDDPNFHYDERLNLLNWANGGHITAREPIIAHALNLLDVDLVCLPNNSPRRFDFLRDEGYEWVVSSPKDRCYER